VTDESPDRWAGLTHAQLEEIYRRESRRLTRAEGSELWGAIIRARDREAPPRPPDWVWERDMERLRGTTFDDPGWAPQVVAHGFPDHPQDRVRVLVPDGEQLVLLVRGMHRGGRCEYRFYQLQSPTDPALSWFLARDDGEVSWDHGLAVGKDSLTAVGWIGEPLVPPTEFFPPPGPPPLRVRVRPMLVDETGKEIPG